MIKTIVCELQESKRITQNTADLLDGIINDDYSSQECKDLARQTMLLLKTSYEYDKRKIREYQKIAGITKGIGG